MMTEGQDEILRIASMTGFSEGAVRTMVEALRAGGGTMAQFDHPELGGFGQWSSGGMLMIGDMFNNSLKGRVAQLADMASSSLYEGRLPVRQSQSQGMGGSGFGFGGGAWWPDGLGQPSSSGSQNGVRYAVFPGARRLALDTGSGVRLYDTGDHQIGGVSQQQGGTSTLRFSSQFGTIAAEDLPLVSGGGEMSPEPSFSQPSPATAPLSQPTMADPAASSEPIGTTASEPQRSGHDLEPSNFVPAEASAAAEPFAPAQQPEPVFQPASQAPASRTEESRPKASAQGDPLELLRKLSDLHKDGILTDEEFQAKKAELLSRL
ncbi:SHOCT domain-containing protein [Fulvimarina manganoxydans]|nr:SHOCT domain-containing protein [Fulvimarina manganoxydans]